MNKEASISKTYQLQTELISAYSLKDRLRFYIKNRNFLKFKEAYCREKIDLEEKDPLEGNTLLNLSAKCNSYEIASFLINEGSEVNTYNYSSNTPLHYAILCSNYELTDLLILKKAEEDARNDKGLNPWQNAYNVKLEKQS